MKSLISILAAWALLVTTAAAQQYPSPTYNNLTLQGNLTLPSKPANTVFASPDGAAGVPSFRALTGKDLPSREINVMDYGASGSNQSTTGTITTGTNTLTVASAIDFKVGQGIRVVGAGPAFTIPQATGFSVAQGGATGAVSYTYAISMMHCDGGIGAPVTASLANGNATLSSVNFITLTFTAGAGNCGTAIWRQVGAGAYVYAGVSTQNGYRDTGWVPNWRPQNIPETPPGAARSRDLITKISAISGLTLTLENNAGTTATTQYVGHDDTAAIKAAIAFASLNPSGNRAQPGGDIRFPCGIFNTSSALRVTAGNVGLTGSGECTYIQPFGGLNIAEFEGVSSSSFMFGNWFENFYVPAYNQFAGGSLFGRYLQTFSNRRVFYDHPYDGQTFTDVNDVRLHNIRHQTVWGYPNVSLNIQSGAGASEYACCFDISDWYVNNLATDATMNGGRRNQTGVRIDGNVATVLARSLAVSNIEGNGFQIGNAVANPTNPPSFLQFVDSSSEFSSSRGVNIDAGQEIFFNNLILHGAKHGNHNMVVGSAAKLVKVTGGRIGNAGGNGVEIQGNDITVTGSSIINNSATNSGGTSATSYGIVAGSASRRVTISGNFIGSQYGVGWVQLRPVWVDPSADNIAIVGNVFNGNSNNAPDITTSTSKVSANNAQ